PPRRECAPAWRSKLLDAMPQIDLVLAIGQYAQAWHLGENRAGSLTDTVISWRRIISRNVSPTIIPLPHPSWRNTGWLKKNPWFEAELVPAMRRLIRERVEDF